ncbi:uncharacterized protein LTR77_005435 [Saxophila tyrrhenica]|uniref:Altered inheritance of mitochondria protein 21 n=1 Tax=Saxophila tyrrhenica TaxID=1690608 RepID=A0AAV9PBG9_9PEZI|nr:hypothetical protein LTR77_005435 [Saxophila tyrrhenica]
MATPTVPPRPSRSSAAAPSGPTAVKDSIPQVPPRPVRKLDPSPSRDLRSPFNEPPNPMGSVNKKQSASNLHQEVPARRPSVTLPSVGQEGSEYASFDVLPPEAHGVKVDDNGSEPVQPEQTRNVSANMPLHAPKASVPQATAKSRIEGVTRTDSTQAAAAGIGKARPDDDVHSPPAESSSALGRVVTNSDDLMRVPSAEQALRSKGSFSRSTPSLHPTTSRPDSIQEGNHELGIPEIGMQIPLYPNAGDVQAPSPAQTQSQFAPGIGFYNDGSQRAHHRRKSSRKEFGPPGSYGMHGHGEQPHDQFEREWIKKHPSQAAIEGFNMHGPPRPETALSSAELNRLVNQANDAGFGTNPDMVGTPGADVAWEATEEYASRRTTPQPSPLPDRKKRDSSGMEPAVQSPLRKASFPFGERPGDSSAIDDDPVIHVEPPAEGKPNKVTGGGYADNAMNFGPSAGNTEEEGGWFDERGDGTPILASDEIMKRPGSAYMQPAVSPEVPHDDYYYESDASHNETSRRNSVRVPSRPSSRPNSMHGEYQGGNLYRFMSHEEHHGSGLHTPLEEIEEYEPLIPEGEEEPKPKPKAIKKRPGLEHHHFPSQDVWEDTPMSLQYSTTVETPEPPREARAEPPPSEDTSTFETPEEEQQRRNKNPNDMWSDSKTLVNKPHARALDEHRPGVQRFPSQDIWEDTPDSMRLVTTVSGPQMDEAKSPPDDRPSTTGVTSSEEEDVRATTGFSRPSVPARPTRRSKLTEEVKPDEVDDGSKDEQTDREAPQTSPDKAKAPAIPERPKPSVPARPARTSRGEHSETNELTKSTSAESAETAKSPPVPKAKPAIPARPAGEKIAALKAGFMSDLNNRLKLGPQAHQPKAREVEEEVVEEQQKAPLADARKGRAKGPARRKPASSPSSVAGVAAEGEEEVKGLGFSMSEPLTMWHIDEKDELQVPTTTAAAPDATAAEVSQAMTEAAVPVPAAAEQEAAAPSSDLPALEKQLSANEAHNTEEPTLTQSMSPERAGSLQMDNIDDRLDEARRSIDEMSHGEGKGDVPSQLDGTNDDLKTVSSADVEAKEMAPTATDKKEEGEVEEKGLKSVVSQAGADEVVESGGVQPSS